MPVGVLLSMKLIWKKSLTDHHSGAVPYVKTNIPTSLLSFECCNDVW